MIIIRYTYAFRLPSRVWFSVSLTELGGDFCLLIYVNSISLSHLMASMIISLHHIVHHPGVLHAFWLKGGGADAPP